MHNKTIIGFGFRMIAIIIQGVSLCYPSKPSADNKTLALIIIAIMLNLIQ